MSVLGADESAGGVQPRAGVRGRTGESGRSSSAGLRRTDLLVSVRERPAAYVRPGRRTGYGSASAEAGDRLRVLSASQTPDPDDASIPAGAGAAAVVTDDYPAFIARRHNRRVPPKLAIPYYAVDSSCIVPMSQMEKREYGAYTIRPKIRKLLPRYLVAPPALACAQEVRRADSGRPYGGDCIERCRIGGLLRHRSQRAAVA